MTGFILTLKESGERRGYTTLVALCEDTPRESLGVSKFTLDRFDLKASAFENSKCRIERLQFRTKGDIIRDRDREHPTD